jgi:hypothetical protein
VIVDLRDWRRRWEKDSLAAARAEVASGGVRLVRIDESPAITYTVGLTVNYGFPELAVAGFESEQAQKLVRKLVDQVRSNGHIPFDQEFLLLKRRAVLKIVENAENRKVASLAHALYKGKFELAQCVFSDPNGSYPWSLPDGVDEDYLFSQICLYETYPPLVKLGKEADREYARHVRQYKSVDTTGEELYPYPGHNKIFLTALDRAVAAAKKSGGLSAFHHIDYRYGDLRIYFEFRREDFSESAYDKIDEIVDQARSKSRSVCILCGGKAAPSPRVQTHGAPLPFCDSHDANLAFAMINLEY